MTLAQITEMVEQARGLGMTIDRVTMRRSDAERIAAAEGMDWFEFGVVLQSMGVELRFSSRAPAGTIYGSD